jgi:hypothetical protein
MAIDNLSFKPNESLDETPEDIVLSSVDYLTQLYTFATLRDTDEIYYYHKTKGIFVPGGDKYIKSEVGYLKFNTNKVAREIYSDT